MSKSYMLNGWKHFNTYIFQEIIIYQATDIDWIIYSQYIMFNANQSSFSMEDHQAQVCPHQWMWSWYPQNPKCHSNLWSQCRKEAGSLHMGMGIGIVKCGKECSCMHKVLSGTSSVVQCSSSRGAVWKSSSSPSSRYTWASRVVLEVDGWGSGLWGVIHGLVLGGASSSEVSTLLEKPYISHLHTGLRWDCPLLHGATGSGSMKHSQHWTHGGSLMFFSVELVFQSFLNHFHNLHLLMAIFMQRWSWSDQIIFCQVADVVYVLMLCKRMLSRLLLWCYWGCVHRDELSRTVVQLWLCSIWNIL